jgi:hypothetical protein
MFKTVLYRTPYSAGKCSHVKGTVAGNRDWLIVMLLDSSALGEEPLMVFKIFSCFQLIININRNAVLQ